MKGRQSLWLILTVIGITRKYLIFDSADNFLFTVKNILFVIYRSAVPDLMEYQEYLGKHSSTIVRRTTPEWVTPHGIVGVWCALIGVMCHALVGHALVGHALVTHIICCAMTGVTHSWEIIQHHVNFLERKYRQICPNKKLWFLSIKNIVSEGFGVRLTIFFVHIFERGKIKVLNLNKLNS